MTTILINILCFTTGFTICSVLSWSVHRRHKQAWQKEYRRLMGGIKYARDEMRVSLKLNDGYINRHIMRTAKFITKKFGV